MDKLQERDAERCPEEMDSQILWIVLLLFDYFVQHMDYVCITTVTVT